MSAEADRPNPARNRTESMDTKNTLSLDKINVSSNMAVHKINSRINHHLIGVHMRPCYEIRSSDSGQLQFRIPYGIQKLNLGSDCGKS